MNIKSKLKFFAGHESFYLREGWLIKGIYAIQADPTIFQGSQLIKAIDALGVGSNMVKAIRYWLEVCGLIEKTKSHTYILKDTAKLIFKYDPYMQHVSTLWILHSECCLNSALWHLIFIEKETNTFLKDRILEKIESRLKELDSSFAKKTIKDSVNVFINTYLSNKKPNDPEDNILSPLSKLKLLKELSYNYTFQDVSYKDFSPYLIYSIKLCQLKKNDKILIDDIYIQLNNIININYNNVRKSIDYLEHEGAIKIDRTAGLNNILIVKELTKEEAYKLMLEDY